MLWTLASECGTPALDLARTTISVATKTSSGRFLSPEAEPTRRGRACVVFASLDGGTSFRGYYGYPPGVSGRGVAAFASLSGCFLWRVLEEARGSTTPTRPPSIDAAVRNFWLGALDSGLRVRNFGLRALNSGLRVRNSGLRALNSGLRVRNSGVGVLNSDFDTESIECTQNIQWHPPVRRRAAVRGTLSRSPGSGAGCFSSFSSHPATTKRPGGCPGRG